MATNYIQLGDSLTIPAPASVLSGDLVIAGEIIGIAAGHAESDLVAFLARQLDVLRRGGAARGKDPEDGRDQTHKSSEDLRVKHLSYLFGLTRTVRDAP